ncbi:MAG: DUF393 domain-containing protein [Betaproteobacteria bacterium]|nr:DUF393 domain-containing protein [Betaproteobacteria bacterium]NBY70454.1 DUF393 domain-containing protein [Betaproteobacteria bacterium]
MNAHQTPETLTVLYDGSCPLCQMEIAHLKGLAIKQTNSALCFVDISPEGENGLAFAVDRVNLMARFHVQLQDGSRLSGAAAFVAMWSRLPGWQWLARLAQLPGMLNLMELAYRVFLHIRPWLQAALKKGNNDHHLRL